MSTESVVVVVCCVVGSLGILGFEGRRAAIKFSGKGRAHDHAATFSVSLFDFDLEIPDPIFYVNVKELEN